MARSLLTKVVSSFWKRQTVVRVTSDVTASTPYQAAAPKPARFEPPPAFDSFGSLVDSNIPPEPSATPAPQRAPNRATADSPAPRDAAPDQSAPSNRTDTGADARQSAPPTAASNSSDTKADASSRHDG